MLILIKNILNVIGKGNKRNYQINNDDLGRRKFCKRSSTVARRKTDFMFKEHFLNVFYIWTEGPGRLQSIRLQRAGHD